MIELDEALIEKVGSRKGSCQIVPSLLQLTLSADQTEQKMEANLGSKPVKSRPAKHIFQDGNSGNNPVILTETGMGNLARFQRCVFPHSNQPKVKKVSKILPEQSHFPIHSSALWSGHCSPRVYKGGQRSETYGSSKGYPNPPVPRRLVIESPVPGNLPTTYPDPFGPLSTVRLGSKHEEIRARTSANLQFRRLLIRSASRSSTTHSGPVDSSPGKVKFHQESEQLHSQTVHVPDRSAYSNRKASLVGTSSYEAHSMAFKTSLACSRGFRKSNTSSPIPPPSSRLVVGREQCADRPTFTPSSARSAAIYRRLK